MPTARFGALPLALLLLAALLLGACGRDKPSHGMERKGFESTPQGDAITPGFAITDGETYSADVAMTMQIRHVATLAGRPNTTERSGRAVLDLVWTMRKPLADAPPTSSVTMRYAEAEGQDAQGYLAREVIHGTLRHGEDGRVQTRTLQLQGGTAPEQLQAQDLFVSLMLAGFAGSYPWTPPRAIRVGETWPLEEFIKPRALENLRRYGRETGLASPEPSFEGTGILRALVEEDGELWLDVEIEALVELSGTASKGTERGQISLGDRITGKARISATRGVPRQFEVSHSRRTQGRSGSDTSDLSVSSTLRGTVVRTLPGK